VSHYLLPKHKRIVTCTEVRLLYGKKSILTHRRGGEEKEGGGGKKGDGQ